MRSLLLLRHAKSSWDDPGLSDLARPLNARGRRAALQMAQAIVDRAWLPDLVLASPARRTRETWERMAPSLPGTIPVVFRDDLYLASAPRLLSILRGTEDHVERLLLLGHNPGLQALAALLAGPCSDTEALTRLERKFPTAALALLRFDGAWAGLRGNGAVLTAFGRPKDLA